MIRHLAPAFLTLRFTIGLLILALAPCALAESALFPSQPAFQSSAAEAGSSFAEQGPEDDFLPVEAAFLPTVTLNGRDIQVHFDIAPDYYLYEHSLTLTVSGASVTEETRFNHTPTPKEDPNFGAVNVFYNEVSLQTSLQQDPQFPLAVQIRYQGCAEQGLCYIPQQRNFVLNGQGTALPRDANSSQAPNTTSTSPPEPVIDQPGWLVALGLAFLGGLILNLMPCVFPVLSLKAMSLSRQAHGDLREQRWHALAYTVGVLATFSLITAVLLALRSGGAAIGWGFQLQNPWVIGGLAYLMFVLGLSMNGVIEFGGRWMGMGQSLTQQDGQRGSFFTGVLAVIVASPCTAPFMGSALGYAVTQPALIAYSVFLALGLGFAAPFLLLAITPAASRWFPKPGTWMDTFKHWMAFPLYLTAIWLVWVLGRQVGVDGMAYSLLGILALAVGCWLWGRSQQHSGGKTGALALPLGVFAIVCLHWAGSQIPSSHSGDGQWESWSEARLQQYRSEGRPVLVNMTADWCITCLANEKAALNTSAVKNMLAEHGIAYLKGDWTRQDPAITDYLAQFKRNGVPLYVVYPADPAKPPQLLPQLLTPGVVIAALQGALPQK